MSGRDIDREVLRHVADLARLEVAPEEEEALAAELGRIAEWAGALPKGEPAADRGGTEGGEGTEGAGVANDGPEPAAGEVEGGAAATPECRVPLGDAFTRNAPALVDGHLRLPPVRGTASGDGAPREPTPAPGSPPAAGIARAREPRWSPERATDPLHAWGARRLAAAVGRREVSALEVVEAHLERLALVDAAEGAPLGAWLEVAADDARGAARRLDRRLAAEPGLDLPLAGVPLAVKDNLSRAGRPLTAASAILEGYVAPFTATAVARLEAAGAVVLGSTNLDELGMGSSTETSRFGPTRNPWDRTRVPGGSSGGSAAAVAAGTVPLALGSDTGGSVRQPAAFCGLVGVRPTWGRVSRHGLVAFASSLDTVGPLARDVLDAARALTLAAGPDPCDATSAAAPLPDHEAAARRRADTLAGCRVGVIRELAGVPLEAGAGGAWSTALATLGRLGCDLVEVSVPDLGAAVAAYHLVAAAEASTNLSRLDGARYGRRRGGGATVDDLYRASRSAGFGPEVRRRILLGTFALSAGHRERYYQRARALAAALRRSLLAALDDVELLVTPTTPGGAFRLGERLDDPLAMYRSDIFTAAASLAGLPAVAVPCGRDGEGLPLSLQVVGRPFGEGDALGLALAFEAAVGWEVVPATAATGGAPPQG